METAPQEARTTIGTFCPSSGHTTHTLPSLTWCLPRAVHVCKPKPETPPEDTSTCACGEGTRRYQVAGRHSHAQTHVWWMHAGQGGEVSQCLGWVWPMLAHRQEGPLQDLTCPGRTEVIKSMPTNKVWPHPVSCLGHSPWQILGL